MRHQGTVTLRVTVGPDGRVLNVVLAQSSGHPELDRAAIRGVKRWTFRPETRDGKAITGVALISINFTLNGAAF